PQSSFSRLPWIHRVSLECHTETECGQKVDMPTTHFYGKNPRTSFSLDGSALYRLGDLPASFLNTRLNCDSDWNPTAKAISLMRRFAFPKSSHAFLKRMRAMYSTKFTPVTSLNFSLR